MYYNSDNVYQMKIYKDAHYSLKKCKLLFSLFFFLLMLISCTPVARIIDGDTILLANNEMIRYIGIDTPEAGEPFYADARQLNGNLLKFKAISFEADVNDRDVYGRFLRYVFANTILVNAELVRRGYAFVYRRGKFPEHRYYEILEKAADEAVRNRRGIWSVSHPHPKLRNVGDYYIPK